MLLGVIPATTGVVAWNTWRGSAPLAFCQSGMSFVAMFFGSTTLATIVLAFMNLSGFKSN